jgi:phosphatidylglycerophosphate synthase
MFVEEYLKDLRKRRYSPPAVGEYVARCLRMSIDAAWHRPKALAGVGMAGLGHLVFLFLLAMFLSLRVDRSLGLDYFIVSSWWLLGGLAWIVLHLGMFRRDEDLPLSGLGLPNFLTLGRLLSIPAFYLFITRNHPLLALLAFSIGGISDVLDGMAARHLGATSRMGRIFDPLVDVLFNVGVVVGLTHAGYLPNWLLALVIIRYGLLILGAAFIYIARGPVAVRPTLLGRTTGVVTTALFLSVVLAVHLLPIERREQVLELLYSAIGFVLLVTIVQVVIIGLYNMRHAGDVPAAEGPFSVVVGRGQSTEDAGKNHSSEKSAG